jgi:hypothetical protein
MQRSKDLALNQLLRYGLIAGTSRAFPNGKFFRPKQVLEERHA